MIIYILKKMKKEIKKKSSERRRGEGRGGEE